MTEEEPAYEELYWNKTITGKLDARCTSCGAKVIVNYTIRKKIPTKAGLAQNLLEITSRSFAMPNWTGGDLTCNHEGISPDSWKVTRTQVIKLRR